VPGGGVRCAGGWRALLGGGGGALCWEAVRCAGGLRAVGCAGGAAPFAGGPCAVLSGLYALCWGAVLCAGGPLAVRGAVQFAWGPRAVLAACALCWGLYFGSCSRTVTKVLVWGWCAQNERLCQDEHQRMPTTVAQ
jgi:hypothetical protein